MKRTNRNRKRGAAKVHHRGWCPVCYRKHGMHSPGCTADPDPQPREEPRLWRDWAWR